MKLGLITDIHEQVELLRSALERLRQERVERVIVLGDVCEMGQRLEETCRLLAESNAIGVWGNHDFGLCGTPAEEVRAAYPSSVLNFMSSLRPRLELECCQFTHVEPWLDPTSIADLWYFDGLPDAPHKLERIFAAAAHRILFGGHFHDWLLVKPTGISRWKGESPIRLSEGRFFAVVGALCDGHFATFDTVSFELVPLRLDLHNTPKTGPTRTTGTTDTGRL